MEGTNPVLAQRLQPVFILEPGMVHPQLVSGELSGSNCGLKEQNKKNHTHIHLAMQETTQKNALTCSRYFHYATAVVQHDLLCTRFTKNERTVVKPKLLFSLLSLNDCSYVNPRAGLLCCVFIFGSLRSDFKINFSIQR